MINKTGASSVRLIKPKRWEDERGWFSETYNLATMADQGIDLPFVQDNHSMSRPRYTLRGMHYQKPPHDQAKLVRCLRGRVFDVVVDIRDGSPTFGKWVGVELSAQNGLQLFVPSGFAHGFLTLEPDCEISYKTSNFYAAAFEDAVAWNDPDLAIEWPIPPGQVPVMSPRDASASSIAALSSPFTYDGQPLISLRGSHAEATECAFW